MPITISDDWSECERGNTWLVSGDGTQHVGYFDLAGGRRLEVTVSPENYPGFNVLVLSAAKSTDKSLAKHVRRLVRDGWEIRKCNLEGIT